jgi:calcineurin-like phosphoesterase family protein
MTTFFTADLHLGHQGIIHLCKRPFADSAAMDTALIANWNATVTPTDTVYVIGDFAHRSSKPASSYLARLNGTKHLIPGNHDTLDTLRAKGWASVLPPFVEIDVLEDGEGRHITMCHYALRTWPRIGKGGLNLFGHSHGRLIGCQTAKGGGQLDVGVDACGYAPVSLKDILRRIRTLPQMPGSDHHYTGDGDL